MGVLGQLKVPSRTPVSRREKGRDVNCDEIGASACGGPDQCAYGKNERLVSFKCDEGTFNGCSPSKDGHPRCP